MDQSEEEEQKGGYEGKRDEKRREGKPSKEQKQEQERGRRERKEKRGRREEGGEVIYLPCLILEDSWNPLSPEGELPHQTLPLFAKKF